jgi:hypothetical protein
MSGILSRVAPWLVVAAAVIAGYFANPWPSEAAQRAVADIAGDDGLPGSAPLQSWQKIRQFSERLGDQRAAYESFLWGESQLVLIAFVGYLAIAWLAWRHLRRRWPVLLIVTACAFAASGWAQHWSLASASYQLAVIAASAKWFFGIASLLLAAAQVLACFGPWRHWFLALFHDVPFFVDRASRRIEFRLNYEYALDGGAKSELRVRPFWRLPPFWLFGTTTVFILYGPTLDGLCSVSAVAVRLLLGAVGLALFAATGWAGYRIVRWMRNRIGTYDFPSEKGNPPQAIQRRVVTLAVLGVCALLMLAPAVIAGSSALMSAADGVCVGSAFSTASLLRFGLCVAAIAAFAVAWSVESSTRRLIRWQALILVSAALIYWFALASAEANEASWHPYRHLFAVVAPVVALVLWLAPGLARRLIGAELGSLKTQFSGALKREELFQPRPVTPLPTRGLVVHALLYGIAYRALQFVLIPALIALVAPSDWLLTLCAAGLLVSIGLSTWGNLSPRWRQMELHVERWFLSGAAFFVSVFVIVVAACRIAGVSYVTTLLDGAPFGTIFSGTVMCYVLSWLAEYWLNRAAGAELLGVLGNPGEKTAIRFTYDGKDDQGVERADRRIMYHALGRFLVAGTMPDRDTPAFHTYSLTEIFTRLSNGQHAVSTARVSRQVHLYFYAVNFLLALTVAGFAGAYAYYYDLGVPTAVVTARGDAPTELLNDLAERLLAPAEDNAPAIVVVASGGGTRAAVFTTHVLEGLHKLGADRHIVLTSGVSGGGVALAYFALHYRELSEASVAATPHWIRFKKAIEDNYIDDVLEGATEWRIFGAAPLSVLLAEAFERRLFAGASRKATFDLPETPALILNTTITGHPDVDSALLRITLNRPAPTATCTEYQRPYRLLHGGRLIFTNIKHTSAFPGRDATIADIRLPYAIVRDPAVPLAGAAALNANFPPVFPNARVELKNADNRTECPDRSYYVTDGGAHENLGLVSALYAVESALAEIEKRCEGAKAKQDPWCARKLRRIHFVIAEASATGYDYSQDRGMSAGLEGGKDRMTGGLTNELIEASRKLYRSLPLEQARGQPIRFHMLAMPLVFRARGGIGTHWTHAETFRLSDPRVRSPLASWIPGELRFVGIRDAVDVDWRNITRMWTAMHEPDVRFCDDAGYGNIDTDEVRRWICGWRFDADRPRDLHVLEWRRLVNALRAPTLIP